MMKFKYTALNQENQQTSGLLEAGSLEAAKEKLHQMDLSILVINRISDEEYSKVNDSDSEAKRKSGILTFTFRAKNAYKQVVDGTIDATDAYSAFKRLVLNYHFDVSGLHMREENDLDELVLAANFEANAKQWKERMQGEGINIEKAMRLAERNEELENEEASMSQKIVEQIDQFIINAKSILRTHSEQFSNAFLEEIQKKLSSLERIRSSSNLKRISQISNELYELLSHPDQFGSSTEEKRSDYIKSLGSIKGNSLIDSDEAEVERKLKSIGMMKGQFDGILGKLRRMVPSVRLDSGSSPTSLGYLARSAFLAWRAPRGPLREARKEDLRKNLAKRRQMKAEEKRVRQEAWATFFHSHFKSNLTLFFLELENFFGWLLAFYAGYFALAGLSLEKGVGLPEAFAAKTLQSPLVLNLTLLLVWAHLTLRIKNRLFREEILGSIFLFSFSAVVYAMVISNV